MNGLKSLRLALAASFFAVAAFAQTAPALRLTDGVNTVTIDANNNVTFSSPCACTTSSSSGVSGNPGRVTWGGTIGLFTVPAIQGNAQNTSFPNPDLALTTIFYGGSGTGTLTASWTSTGYTGPIVGEGVPQSTFTGTGSAVYSYYIDNTNAVFGTGSLVGTLTETTTGTVSSPIWPTTATGTYSITLKEAITLNAGATFNGDNQFQFAAETLSTSCPVASATQNVAYSSTVGATGGNPPYSFAIISGALPAGLTLNATTGAITGTPTVAGNFSYTVQVTDSYSYSVSSTCGMTVAMASGGGQGGLTVKCPKNSGTAGSCYSSSVIATGGVAPYRFKVTAGSLPPGLTLNTSTGAISGTPQTAGTYTFSITATDSTGEKKSTYCNGNGSGSQNDLTGSASCTITIAASSGYCSGHSPQYWQQHQNEWGCNGLQLGDRVYNKAQCVQILSQCGGSDSSVNLAAQLIAAKLNVLHGKTPDWYTTNQIASADAQLCGYSKPIGYNNSGYNWNQEQCGNSLKYDCNQDDGGWDYHQNQGGSCTTGSGQGNSGDEEDDGWDDGSGWGDDNFGNGDSGSGGWGWGGWGWGWGGGWW